MRSASHFIELTCLFSDDIDKIFPLYFSDEVILEAAFSLSFFDKIKFNYFKESKKNTKIKCVTEIKFYVLLLKNDVHHSKSFVIVNATKEPEKLSKYFYSIHKNLIFRCAHLSRIIGIFYRTKIKKNIYAFKHHYHRQNVKTKETKVMKNFKKQLMQLKNMLSGMMETIGNVV
ncbi:hypothetical protein TRFO_17493 [Tritrichomonas foetus]|uniref:Uncharacterized protein n=1 Tax=Tritrichomonas foetus TaxID=1144522 RepID=A0A1J4KSM4_9EUKA|nr:hypothetical protein TRFO_17493 [Tritrichomonas foetus]|eukprot:OHT12662.1 hypothetical protein TRFO_17493 [Tritrichomonas foetus]